MPSQKNDSTCEQTQVIKNVFIQIGGQSCSSTLNKDIQIEVGKQVCEASIEKPQPPSYSNFLGNRKPVV